MKKNEIFTTLNFALVTAIIIMAIMLELKSMEIRALNKVVAVQLKLGSSYTSTIKKLSEHNMKCMKLIDSQKNIIMHLEYENE